MAGEIPGIEADIDTLSTVIPSLASNLTQIRLELANEETTLKAKEASLAEDDAELAVVKGEIAQLGVIKEKLDPIVNEAKGLLPADNTSTGQPPTDASPAPAAGNVETQGGAPSSDQPSIETPITTGDPQTPGPDPTQPAAPAPAEPGESADGQPVVPPVTTEPGTGAAPVEQSASEPTSVPDPAPATPDAPSV